MGTFNCKYCRSNLETQDEIHKINKIQKKQSIMEPNKINFILNTITNSIDTSSVSEKIPKQISKKKRYNSNESSHINSKSVLDKVIPKRKNFQPNLLKIEKSYPSLSNDMVKSTINHSIDNEPNIKDILNRFRKIEMKNNSPKDKDLIKYKKDMTKGRVQNNNINYIIYIKSDNTSSNRINLNKLQRKNNTSIKNNIFANSEKISSIIKKKQKVLFSKKI